MCIVVSDIHHQWQLRLLRRRRYLGRRSRRDIDHHRIVIRVELLCLQLPLAQPRWRQLLAHSLPKRSGRIRLHAERKVRLACS